MMDRNKNTGWKRENNPHDACSSSPAPAHHFSLEDVKMARAFGLPGNIGAKAHYYFVCGHADACNGAERRGKRHLSKTCHKAYDRGYTLGIKQKKGE